MGNQNLAASALGLLNNILSLAIACGYGLFYQQGLASGGNTGTDIGMVAFGGGGNNHGIQRLFCQHLRRRIITGNSQAGRLLPRRI